jgi:hypothetical protein
MVRWRQRETRSKMAQGDEALEDREDCSLAARAIFTAMMRASPEPWLIDPATETEIAEAVTLIGETRPSDCEPG